MQNRTSLNSQTRSVERSAVSLFHFLFSIFILLIGCGAPGDPTPPSPTIPAAITDLSGAQAGDGVRLTFTIPVKTVTGERLTDPPAVEILRGAATPAGPPDAKSFRVVYTIPAALVNNYQSEDHVQFVDPLPPDEVRAHPGGTLVYRVRTRASRKRASADSNAVTVRLLPVPERIAALQPKITEDAVELTWAAPTRTSNGQPLTAISEYRVYRGELDPSDAEAALKDPSQVKWKSPLAFLGSSRSTS